MAGVGESPARSTRNNLDLTGTSLFNLEDNNRAPKRFESVLPNSPAIHTVSSPLNPVLPAIMATTIDVNELARLLKGMQKRDDRVVAIKDLPTFGGHLTKKLSVFY